jgi:hypothetical protein
MSTAFGMGGVARRAGAVVQDGAAPQPPSEEDIFDQRLRTVYGAEEGEDVEAEPSVIILQEPWKTAVTWGFIGSVLLLGVATTDLRPSISAAWHFVEKLATPTASASRE